MCQLSAATSNGSDSIRLTTVLETQILRVSRVNPFGLASIIAASSVGEEVALLGSALNRRLGKFPWLILKNLDGDLS